MGRFRTFIENTDISGEFWITEDGLQEAGGDGDYNHEAYALQHIQYQVANSLDVDQSLLDNEYIDWDAIQISVVENYIDSLDEQQQLQLRQQLGIPQDEDLMDQRENIFDIAAHEAGIDDETLSMASGYGDARKYAIKHWGWKRVVDNNVETWQLTPNDMRIIANGIAEIDESLTDDTPVYIYVYSTGQSHDAMLGDLEQGRLQHAPVPQIQASPTQLAKASTQSVRNAEIEKLHPYYKDISPRSQSFPFGDWRIWSSHRIDG